MGKTVEVVPIIAAPLAERDHSIVLGEAPRKALAWTIVDRDKQWTTALTVHILHVIALPSSVLVFGLIVLIVGRGEHLFSAQISTVLIDK